MVISRVVFSSFEILMPSEAHGALGSLLDVVSRLSHLLAKAGHVLEYLPEFLQAYKITALLDTPDFQQVCVCSGPRGKIQLCCVFVFAAFACVSLSSNI